MFKLLVTQLHRWLGVPLGILFLVTLITGIAVGVADLLDDLDRKGQTYRPTSIAEDARALERMTRDMPGLFQAVLPTPRTPFYQARARGETRTYRIGDLEPIDHEVSAGNGGLYRTMLGLHRTFLLGRQDGALGFSGADIVAWVSLLAGVLGLIGIWLWWPYRSSFRWKRSVPLGWTRSEMFRSHMTGGVVTIVAVVLLCVTGAAITYRGAAAAMLGASRISDTGMREAPYYLARDWTTWLDAATQEMDGELTVVSFPRRRGRGGGQVPAPALMRYGALDPAAAVQFRFVTGGDWLGMAGSRVYLDPRQSALIGAARFEDLPIGQRLYNLIVPLHAGRGVTPAYLVALLIGTVLVTVMTFTGIVSFVLKHVRRLAHRSVAAPSPGGDRAGAEVRAGASLAGKLFGAGFIGGRTGGEATMRSLVITGLLGAALGGASGYTLASGGSGPGVAVDDGTPSPADATVAVPTAAPDRPRTGAEPGRRLGGGRGHSGPNAGRQPEHGGHRHGTSNAGRGPGGGGRGGARETRVGFNPADLERSLAQLAILLALDESQQQAIRDVMRESDERMRSSIRAVLTAEQRRNLGASEGDAAR